MQTLCQSIGPSRDNRVSSARSSPRTQCGTLVGCRVTRAPSARIAAATCAMAAACPAEPVESRTDAVRKRLELLPRPIAPHCGGANARQRIGIHAAPAAPAAHRRPETCGEKGEQGECRGGATNHGDVIPVNYEHALDRSDQWLAADDRGLFIWQER